MSRRLSNRVRRARARARLRLRMALGIPCPVNFCRMPPGEGCVTRRGHAAARPHKARDLDSEYWGSTLREMRDAVSAAALSRAEHLAVLAAVRAHEASHLDCADASGEVCDEQAELIARYLSGHRY